jgi:hypothetical protein
MISFIQRLVRSSNSGSAPYFGFAGVITMTALAYFMGFRSGQKSSSKSSDLERGPSTQNGGTLGNSAPPAKSGGFHVPVEVETMITGGTIQDAIDRIFKNKDLVQRSAAFHLLLSTMTPANGMEIKEAMVQNALKTGISFDKEWHAMVIKLGMVMGEAAMDMEDLEDRKRVMLGWAQANPDAALACIDNKDPKEQYWLRREWLAGSCKADPARALSVLLSDPDFKGLDSGTFMQITLQNHGFSVAQGALQSALDNAQNDVANDKIFTDVFSELGKAMLARDWKTGATKTTCNWLEQQRGAPYLTNTLVSHAAYDYSQKNNPYGFRELALPHE